MDANKLIELLRLKPLQGEGGYYLRTYTGPGAEEIYSVPNGGRAISSAIYYLITPESFSRLHRLPHDELFHFYIGDVVEQLQLYPDGAFQVFNLGHDLEHGQRPQQLVPRKVWQGTRLKHGGRFALLGTTMAPGWEDTDLELAVPELLINQYPAARSLITNFCP